MKKNKKINKILKFAVLSVTTLALLGSTFLFNSNRNNNINIDSKIINRNNNSNIFALEKNISSFSNKQEFKTAKQVIAKFKKKLNEKEKEAIVMEYISKFNKDWSFYISKYTNYVFFTHYNESVNLENSKIIELFKNNKIFEFYNIAELKAPKSNTKKNISSYKHNQIKNNAFSQDYFNMVNFSIEERKRNLDLLKDKLNNTNSRIKIGILDDGQIETNSHFDKDIAKITNRERFWWFNNGYGKHATDSAAIAGGKNGVNPYAHLYGIKLISWNGPQQEIEWLISNGVKVINLSVYLSMENVYNSSAKYLDELSINENNEVTFFIASGNLENEDKKKLENRGLLGDGLAYNAISVGSINDYGQMSKFSSWRSLTAKIPNIVAPGEKLWINNSGTSFSSPFVASLVSLLMEEKKNKYAMGLDSIITLSALTSSGIHKITGFDYTKNAQFQQIDNESPIQKYFGSGKFDYKRMRSALDSLEYLKLRGTSNIAKSQNNIEMQSIYLKKGEKIKVGLAWNFDLNFGTRSVPNNGYLEDYSTKELPIIEKPIVHDLDLEVTSPSGKSFSSRASSRNVEAVYFEAPEAGIYKVNVIQYKKVSENQILHLATSYVKEL